MTRPNLTGSEKAWIAYDIGDSAFALIVWTTVMPIYFKEHAAASLPGSLSTSYWGFANAAAALLVALLGISLGAAADIHFWKKRIFLIFWSCGIAGTLLLAFTPTGGWLYALLIFALARIGWGGALFVYDAFLPDVTEPGRMDRVSANGYTAGYIGSVVPFLVVIGLFLLNGGEVNRRVISPVFLIVALWWAGFSLPLLRNVHQRHFRESVDRPRAGFFTRLAGLFREISRNSRQFRFLVAYFCYIDGVDTLISMSAAYGVDVGLKPATLLLAILMIQLVAFPCTWIYGRLAARIVSFSLIRFAIAIYGAVTLIAFFLPDLRGQGARTAMFWLLALLTATSLGGIQALSRSAFARMIPPHRSAEFFSVYNILGRFAAIAGPFIMGLGARYLGHARWGLLGILILFLAGYFVLPAGNTLPEEG